MMPVSATTPKPLVCCGDGRSMLRTQIDWLSRSAENVHVTVGYRKDMVSAEAIAAGAASVTDVGSDGNAAWIGQSPLGLLDEPVVVTTADNLMDLDVQAVVDEFVALENANGMLVCVDSPSRTAGDRIKAERGVVTGIRRTTNGGRVACGFQVLNPTHVRAAASGATDFSEIWAKLIGDRTLFVSEHRPTNWIAVDQPDDLSCLANWKTDRGTGR